jgi:hypothetical protein
MENGRAFRKKIATGAALTALALSTAACGGRGATAETATPASSEGAPSTNGESTNAPASTADTTALEAACNGEIVRKTIDKLKTADDKDTHVRLEAKDDAQALQGPDENGVYEDVTAPEIERSQIRVVDQGKYNCTIPNEVFRFDYKPQLKKPDGSPVSGETPIFFNDDAFVQNKG